MGLINRHAIILAPKVPFISWIKKTAPEVASDLPKEPLDHDAATIYLIPEFESPEDGLEWLEENFESFFEAELYNWSENDDNWPELTLDNFQKWFHVSYQSMIENTVEGPLLEEEEEGFEDED
jgi:hypothetical protein